MSDRGVHADTRATHERRRLFDDEVMEQHGFIDQFMEAAEATPQPELDGIIAEMDKEREPTTYGPPVEDIAGQRDGVCALGQVPGRPADVAAYGGCTSG